MREKGGERERREQQLHGNMLIVHGRLKGETLVDDERYTPQRPFVPLLSFIACVHLTKTDKKKAAAAANNSPPSISSENE